MEDWQRLKMESKVDIASLKENEEVRIKEG
jgi:hypothetical protein